MSEIHKELGSCILMKDGAHFGISDTGGELLLPYEYDSIFYEGGGFIITKNSKSGYIKFCEKIPHHNEYEAVPGFPQKGKAQFLPCIYDRIEPTRNGLVLYSMVENKFCSEKRAWFDFQSGKLYENLYFMRNHGEFDEFLDMNKGSQMPHLKKAGEDFYVCIPFDL